ncbi:MAG: response regulator [Bdellovibrionia bacterium]
MKFVLIAENDKAHQVLLRKVFENLGFATYEAANCDQALGVLKDRPIDLIVAAPTLPGGDFLKKVRDSHTEKVPFVFLADVDNAKTLAAHAEAFDGYLLKPVTPARAEAKIADLFPETTARRKSARAM